MDEQEARRAISQQINVTRLHVASAKASIIKSCGGRTPTRILINGVLASNQAVIPKQIVLHASADTPAQIKRAADGLSWQLAAQEAIWSLIHADLLLPLDGLYDAVPGIGWTTVA